MSKISFTVASVAAAGCIEDASTLDGFALDGEATLRDAALTDADPSDDPLDGAVTADGGAAALTDAALTDAALTDAALTDAALTDAALTDAATQCPGPEDPEARQACCEALGWPPDQPHCSPWGPPMPPRMLA